MAPTRKRENRENQFYDVGVQGRKTGITLEDRGVRDEHGLEPISGIFSSPEKSPPKRAFSSRTGGTLSESEPMDIQESSIPDLATSTKLLRSARTHLPPPKARSPMKTALGSSPRRQSSMGRRAQTTNPTSSPSRSASHPAISRRLDFEQEESSLQETPALSGSGQRRGNRRSVYSIEPSPSRATSSAMMEESLQEEIFAAEDSAMLNGVAEESDLPDLGNDTVTGAEAEVEPETEVTVDIEESEVVSEPIKAPAKRGRKRKSDAIEPAEAEEEAPKPRKRGPKPKATEPFKNGKKTAPAPVAPSRRSKRVSDITEQEPSSILEASAGAAEQADTSPVVAKPRGRPAKAKPQPQKPQPESAPPTKKKHMQQESDQEKENEVPVFKKPKIAPKPKKTDPKASEKKEKQLTTEAIESGKLVDVYGKPISKAELDQMSVTSVGSRFGRGRHLSVYRELEPESVARVGLTGRHRVAPINFWANETISYDPRGNMQAIVKKEFQEPPPRKHKSGPPKGKKSALAAAEDEEEEELEPWEEEEGTFAGIYRDFDPLTEITTETLVESTLGWSHKGISPTDVADASFKFQKLASAGDESFLSWGFIELDADQMKRSKNVRRMHMVFHVTSGAVEAKIHESVFTVHRGGVFQVPRGNNYSIKNVSAGTSRLFFAQGLESHPEIN